MTAQEPGGPSVDGARVDAGSGAAAAGIAPSDAEQITDISAGPAGWATGGTRSASFAPQSSYVAPQSSYIASSQDAAPPVRPVEFDDPYASSPAAPAAPQAPHPAPPAAAPAVVPYAAPSPYVNQAPAGAQAVTPYPVAGYGAPAYLYSAPPQRQNGLAVTAMCLGLGGVLFGWLLGVFGWLACLGAVICGHIALAKAAREPNIDHGRPLALTGLIAGYVGIVLGGILGVIWVIIMVAGSR